MGGLHRGRHHGGGHPPLLGRAGTAAGPLQPHPGAFGAGGSRPADHQPQLYPRRLRHHVRHHLPGHRLRDAQPLHLHPPAAGGDSSGGVVSLPLWGGIRLVRLPLCGDFLGGGQHSLLPGSLPAQNQGPFPPGGVRLLTNIKERGLRPSLFLQDDEPRFSPPRRPFRRAEAGCSYCGGSRDSPPGRPGPSRWAPTTKFPPPPRRGWRKGRRPGPPASPGRPP